MKRSDIMELDKLEELLEELIEEKKFAETKKIFLKMNEYDIASFIEDLPEEMIINSATGKNENGANSIGYTVKYNSGLNNPNIRFKLYRRNYNKFNEF